MVVRVVLLLLLLCPTHVFAQHDAAHGVLGNLTICYGPYRDGQSPGGEVSPTRSEIIEDLTQLREITGSLRLYGSTGIWRDIAELASGLGFDVMGGVWLDSDEVTNDQEIAAAIDLANRGFLSSIIVGNEVLLREDLIEEEIIGHLRYVRRHIPASVRLTTAESWADWINHPALLSAVDFVTVHIYPFWEGFGIDEAADCFLRCYDEVRRNVFQMPVIVGETGWPSNGSPERCRLSVDATPGADNQRRYFDEVRRIAAQEGITVCWFAAYDEEWKWSEGRSGGTVRDPDTFLDYDLAGTCPGSSWGIFSSDGTVKPHFESVFTLDALPTTRGDRIVFDERGLASFYDIGVDSQYRQTDWLELSDQALRMDYPGRQDWGAVFVTVGEPRTPPRAFRCFSGFTALSLDLRGECGGESVEIGLKDDTAPDDGSEATALLSDIGTEWRRYEIDLSRFPGTDLARLYVVMEFVFSGRTPQTIYCRDITYVR